MKRGTPQSQSRRQARPAAGQRHRRLTVENLESRQLLAAAIGSGGVNFNNPYDFLNNTGPRNLGTVPAFTFQESEGATGRGQNDSLQTAQLIPLGTGTGQQHTVDIRGNLPPFQTGGFGGTLFEDVDYFAADLKAGDILDISVNGVAGSFDVLHPNGRLWFGTETNQAAFYPANSPLMDVGNAVGAQVVPADGRYTIRIGRSASAVPGTNSYQAALRVYRPVLEQQAIGVQQKVFLDFDGAIVTASSLQGLTGTLRIPSLADSLNLINLNPNEEDRLIDRVLEELEERFRSVAQFGGNGDFNETGIPGQFGIQFLNSRDHSDPGVDPFTTRAIIGGSTADILTPDVLGISTTLDIGNFNPGDLVFLPVEFFEDSVIDIPRASSASLLDVLAARLATTIAHEVAHSFGIRHTDPLSPTASVIDTGGTAQVQLNAVGVGPDGIYGTADDVPVVFPQFDRFDPLEGYFGNEYVAASLAWGLATGTQGAALTGTVFNDANRDGQRGSSGEPGLGGLTVFVDANNNGQFDPGELSTTTAANGTFSLPVGAGNHRVSVVAPDGFIFTTPQSRTVSGGASNVNFGLHRPDAAFTGRKFADLNGNGFADAGEPGISDVFIYVDVDGDGQIDIGEPRAKTDENGNYTLSFDGLLPGTYAVREVVAPGFEQTAPAGGFYTVQYDGLRGPTGLNFGNRPSRDFGDAPDSYGTSLANGGPSHGIVAGLHLGQRVDRDLDGQPSAQADADDNNGPVGGSGQVQDDEDGVRLLTPLAAGAPATFEVTVTNTTGQTGYLQAWFDFGQDGSFGQNGDHVLRNVVLPAGSNQVTVNIPAGVDPGNLFTRWRYSLTPDLGSGGAANSGEVEDHRFTVQAQAAVANDDTVSVSRNSQATAIDVLANDFETPDNRLRITSIDRSALGTRGTVTVGPNGRTLFYTPPTGFVGQDRFTYTVTPEVGPAATATVTVNVTYQSDVPVALDDTFEVAQGSNNIALNVLDNDLPSSQGGITIISVTPGSEGGTTSLAGGNQSVRYTPRPGFSGTEHFTYTISDAAGNISSATATVNLLPNSRNDDVVGFKIEFVDVVNNQPITDIQAGDEFLARVTVEDLRSPLDRSGVFSAFLDLLYTDELVAVVPDVNNPLGFDIRFGSQFQSGIGLQNGDANTPGMINEAGSQRPLGGTPSADEGPQELFSVRFQALAAGIAVFAANPADDPVNETTVYNRMTALAERELRLGVAELVISPSGTSFTSAIDDAYPNGRDSLGNPIRGGVPARLDVLDNDILGATGTITEFFLVNQPDHGIASVDNGVITYTPDSNVLNQFDSFTYAIVTADGVRSTAEVTLFVGDPIAAQNNAPAGAKPFDVDISLRVVDGAGNAVSRVTPGSRFGVQVIVQDLRAALAVNPLGVFAAFTDILYDADLAVPSNMIQGDPFDFDVVFGPEFGVTGAFGIADKLGVIDEFGSFLTNTNPSNNPPNPALTDQPVLLATLYFDAVGTGELRMATSPADALPFRDTLLFQPPEPVAVSRIRYNVTTVTIGGGNGEGETLQNALLPADVNSDGLVTPIDALLIINSLSRARAAGEGEAAARSLYTDVNGDGSITPLDALQVINHLGRARRGDAPVDLAQLSALTPSADGVVPVQSYAALYELLNQRYAADFSTPESELQAAPTPEGYSDSDEEEDDALLSLLADDVSQLWQ